MSEELKRQLRWLYQNGFIEFIYGPESGLNKYGQTEGEFLDSILAPEEWDEFFAVPAAERSPRAHGCIRRSIPSP